MRAAMEDLGGEDGHQDDKGHSHEADHGEQKQDGADGDESGDVGPAGLQFCDGG